MAASRTRRALSDLAFVIAWLPFLAVLFAWGWAASSSDEWSRPRLDDASHYVGSISVLTGGGRVMVQFEQMDEPLNVEWPARGTRHGPGRIEGTWPFNERGGAIAGGGWGYDVRRDVVWTRAAHSRGSTHGVTYTSLIMPFYGPAIVTGTLPVAWTLAKARRARRRRHRARAGLCLDCGYDLRATADGGRDLIEQCPECGLLTPAGAYAAGGRKVGARK